MTNDEKQALHIKIARDTRYRRIVDVKEFDVAQSSIIRVDTDGQLVLVYAAHATGDTRDGIELDMVAPAGIVQAIRRAGEAAKCVPVAIEKAVAAAQGL